ncbi:MAG: dihydrofolate reductase [Thermoanaerobaculia bacterium]|nr:dihydrofolate reductase [Thermoanaerobaculia bacterium]
MELIVIAAVGCGNRVIGRDGGLPWNIPDEYQQFLEHIRGHTVIMGRISWEIFGEDLTSARHIVLTRNPRKVRNAITVPSFEQALERAEAIGSRRTFVAGGASVYEEALSEADALYLSYVKGEYSGDTFFPDFDPADWSVEWTREHPAFEFVAYGRRAVA